MQKKIVIFIIAVFPALVSILAHCDQLIPNQVYVCPPCAHVKNVFETETYHEDGQCPVCGMNLIEQPSQKSSVKPEIHFGSGNFQFNSQRSNAPSPINIYYHKPAKFTPDSKILLVIPGAGRNAWDYRDSWVKVSEKFNVLVVSPEYPEEKYNYAAYHLAGIVSDIEFRNISVSKANGRVNKYHVADKDVIKGELTSSNHWLFNDFDDIFDQVVLLSQSNRQNYDIFGHSAGGQILHRMAIFYTGDKADRIIASNSGTYTLPSTDYEYPLGIKGVKLQDNEFKDIFSRNLTLLVGQKDNAKEERGTMLHTPILDKRGLGRLSRGQNFYKESENSASEADVELDWTFCVVKGVGHDHKKMGLSAAKLLYDGQKCINKMSI